jgi:hypothetical protein
MPRIRLPKDWKCRVTRAVTNLKKPGVGAACFWCGHPYRIGPTSCACRPTSSECIPPDLVVVRCSGLRIHGKLRSKPP